MDIDLTDIDAIARAKDEFWRHRGVMITEAPRQCHHMPTGQPASGHIAT